MCIVWIVFAICQQRLAFSLCLLSFCVILCCTHLPKYDVSDFLSETFPMKMHLLRCLNAVQLNRAFQLVTFCQFFYQKPDSVISSRWWSCLVKISPFCFELPWQETHNATSSLAGVLSLGVWKCQQYRTRQLLLQCDCVTYCVVRVPWRRWYITSSCSLKAFRCRQDQHTPQLKLQRFNVFLTLLQCCQRLSYHCASSLFLLVVEWNPCHCCLPILSKSAFWWKSFNICIGWHVFSLITM